MFIIFCLNSLSVLLSCKFLEFCKIWTFSTKGVTWKRWLAKFPHLEFCASQFSFFLSVYLCVFDFLFISHYFMHHTNNVVCSNSMTPADLSTLEFQVCPKQPFLNLWLCNFSGTCLLIRRQSLYLKRATGCLFNFELFSRDFQFLFGKDWWPTWGWWSLTQWNLIKQPFWACCYRVTAFSCYW